MKKGFTLAEVLITLAIIGVVAALTIPVLMTKYQKSAMYSHFRKTYNVLQTAFSASILKNGDMEDWDAVNETEFLQKYLTHFSRLRNIVNQAVHVMIFQARNLWTERHRHSLKIIRLGLLRTALLLCIILKPSII